MRQAPSLKDKTAFQQIFRQAGCCMLPDCLSIDQVVKLKEKLALAIERETCLHRETDDESLVACCPWHDDYFLTVLQGEIFAAANDLLGDDCILYSYSNSCLKPGKGNFSSHIHVERYYTTGSHLEAVGTMILLDDFTEQNGATWFLAGSQNEDKRPTETVFLAQAKRLLAPAGTVFFFHPHLWHMGGENHTSKAREALTVGFCRPYMKQRLDLPTLFARKRDSLPPDIIQKLGFHAASPASIADFYQRRGGVWSNKISYRP